MILSVNQMIITCDAVLVLVIHEKSYFDMKSSHKNRLAFKVQNYTSITFSKKFGQTHLNQSKIIKF